MTHAHQKTTSLGPRAVAAPSQPRFPTGANPSLTEPAQPVPTPANPVRMRAQLAMGGIVKLPGHRR
jgi:hypothetical protein